jgi:hypothetical protein
LIFENTKSNIGIEMKVGKGNDVYEVNAKLKIEYQITKQNRITLSIAPIPGVKLK